MAKLSYWYPTPDRVIQLYENLDQGPGHLDLEWKCPGRRAPELDKQEEGGASQQEAEQVDKQEAVGSNDFDFDDEEGGFESVGLSTPQQRRIPGGTLRGSARKKTTSLDSVLSNMRRHKIIEDKEYKTEENK